MKFHKKYNNGKPIWDAQREGTEFLRIIVNNSGQYVLYRCYGLASNGITPLRSDLIARTSSLNACKAKARELFEPKEQRKAVTDYSHVRMPYKD